MSHIHDVVSPHQQLTDPNSGRVPGNFYSFEFFIEVHLDDADTALSNELPSKPLQ